MRISKENYDKLKKGGKRAVKGAVAGGKSSIYEGGAGAVVAYAEPQLEKIDFVKSRPYVKGIVVAGIGHFLKRKKSMGNLGAALCGAGGLLLGQYMRDKKKTAPAQAPAAPAVAAPPVAPPAATETQGFDTGRVVRFARPETGFIARGVAAR